MSGAWGPAFRPWLEERILEDSDELLVVDKPAGIPTHGGDAELVDDVVGRLRLWLEASGRDPYLGVHQRLDLGTSGVLVFVRDRAKNASLQADFERGQVKKRYVAAVHVTSASPLARGERILLQHRLEPDGKRYRVTARGGKECRAECQVLARVGARALVELAPETGRTHQLRVQLAAVGAPIGGDHEYGGALAPRLLLHAERLELPSLQRRFASEVPPSFRRWLSGAEPGLGARAEVRRKLRDAACRRYPLLAQNEALRWVNAAGDELPGVELDWYGGYAVLSLSSDEASARQQELVELAFELGARGVYLKLRARADLRQRDHAELAPAAPLLGLPAPDTWVVREGAHAFSVALAEGLSTGLFLDQRDNRRRIGEFSPAARVLNLFSYTCSFSVAAAAGGAARVTSVDLSRRALRRGQDNFRLNGLDPEAHGFVCEDAVRYLERIGQRGERFDLVVLDPPSFSTSGKGKVLRVERDYERLCRLALAVLTPAGRLLAVTNHRGTSPAALRRIVLAAAQAEGREGQAKLLASGLDFPDAPEGPAPSKSLLFSARTP